MAVDLSNLYDRKFLVFSDESGTWSDHNPDGFYVRSWIKITPHEYEKLRCAVQNSKTNTGVKELKWDNFRKNPRDFGNIFSAVNFDVFITISKPNYFLSSSDSYHIVQSINNTSLPLPGTFPNLESKIREKIINSVKNELFFNYFERTHIENSKTVLAFNEAPQNYAYVIDHPQYSGSSWTDIATECGIDRVRIIRDSQNCPGIELADVVAGCINTFLILQDKLQKVDYDWSQKISMYPIERLSDLLNDGRNHELIECRNALSNSQSAVRPILEIFGEYMGSKMTDMSSKVAPNSGKAPNPNLVFIENFSTPDRIKLEILRQNKNTRFQSG